MEEKAFKEMGIAGSLNLVIGICTIVGGITSGILLIVHGAKLLSKKKYILF